MDAVSINEKENRELDIIFSKTWSENISNVFIKDFRCVPSSRAVLPSSHQELSVWFQMVFFCLEWCPHPPWVGTSFQHREGKHTCYGHSTWPLLTSFIFLCPLDDITFPTFGWNWKLDLLPLKILFGFWRMSNNFSSSRTSSTCWSILLKTNNVCDMLSSTACPKIPQ